MEKNFYKGKEKALLEMQKYMQSQIKKAENGLHNSTNVLEKTHLTSCSTAYRIVLNKINNKLSKLLPPSQSEVKECDEYEYEMFFNSQPGDFIQIHGWYPIATDRIRHPEKIQEYIEKGLLRKIKPLKQ